MKAKIRYVLRFVSFILILITVLSVSSHLFYPKDNSASSGMENPSANGILGEKENTIDVLILGDSEAYSAFSPMKIWKETGYTSYVCATAGQTLNYTSVMLSRAFDKQTPKYVFLETDAIYRPIGSYEAFLTDLSNIFSVFQYHDRWKSLSWNDLIRIPSFSSTNASKGYYNTGKIVPADTSGYMKQSKAVRTVANRNAGYVAEIKDFCEKKGAKLVLISTPSTKNRNYEKHNGSQRLAQELKCDYIDLNLLQNELNIDWSKDTRDAGDHLNHSGAAKVSAYLSKYLRRTGVFSDHRSDSNYHLWCEAQKKA